jgi:hypothetical protein
MDRALDEVIGERHVCAGPSCYRRNPVYQTLHRCRELTRSFCRGEETSVVETSVVETYVVEGLDVGTTGRETAQAR